MNQYKTVEVLRCSKPILISELMPYYLRDITDTTCHIKKDPPKPWGKKGRRQQKRGKQ